MPRRKKDVLVMPPARRGGEDTSPGPLVLVLSKAAYCPGTVSWERP